MFYPFFSLPKYQRSSSDLKESSPLTTPVFVLLCLCLPLLLFTAPVAASPKGPFYLPALGASESIRTVPSFVAADEHRDNKVRFNTNFRWVNLWVHHVESEEHFDWANSNPDTFPFEYGTYLIDVEMYTVTHRFSYQALDNLSVEVSMPVHYYGGGVMDGFIEGFHDLFNIGQHNRTDWTQDETHLFFLKRDGTMLYESDNISGTFPGNCELGAAMNLYAEGPYITLRTLAKLPTSRESSIFDQNGFDFTVQGLLSWHTKKWSGYHGVGITRFGSKGSGEIDFYRVRGSTLNTFEYKLSKKTSILLHTVTASPIAEYPEFDSPVVETTFGFKRKLRYGVFEFGLIENLFFFDNSPDFGVHFGYSAGFL